MKNIKKILGLFIFICIFMFSATNVDAKTVEVATFDEFVKYAQREETQTEKVTEIKLVNNITISDYVGIVVEDELTIDLNGKKLDINEELVAIMYGTDFAGTTFYESGTLTFKDSSREKNGMVDNIQTLIIFNSGKDTFGFVEPNEANQDYKLIIDGGTFKQTSILDNGGVLFDCMFSLVEASNEAWHDNVKFTFEVNDGNFEAYNNNELATSVLFGGVIEYGESNENPNLDINLNLKKLRFRSKNGQLIKNYNYDFDHKINDVISNSSKLYIGNTTLNKIMEITDRTISAVGSLPTSVYSNTMESYEYMKVEVIVEKIVYKFLEGANQTYTISKDKELRFRIDADYSVFNNLVYVDGKLVDRNNYTSESGSTIIVLKQSYLDTLKVGEHTFKVEFSDGAEVETKFIIAQLEKEEANPKTSDNILLYVVTGIISLVGLSTIGIYIYRKKQNI